MTQKHQEVLMQDSTVYLRPEDVCAMVPGLTKSALAQMRYTGRGGPVWLKPAGTRTILYRQADVVAWLERSEHTRTDRPSLSA